MNRVALESSGNWSGGGSAVLRNLAMALPEEVGHDCFPLIARNVAPASLVWSGRFLAMPQNCLPWVHHRTTPSEGTKIAAMRVLSEVTYARARLIIRISEAIPSSRFAPSTPVLHNVIDSAFDGALDARAEFTAPFPYVACVGSINSYRNLARLVLAHSAYSVAGGTLGLIIVGRPHTSALQELERKAQKSEGNLWIISEHVDRATVLSIFRQAQGAIFPSLAEASPLSVLETLTVQRNIQLSQIAGHYGLLRANGINATPDSFFGPTDLESMRQAFERLERGQEIPGSFEFETAQGRRQQRAIWSDTLRTYLAQYGFEPGD